MNDSNLAQRVKELRNRAGLTQEVLAENSGLSLRTIQRIENNETVPRGDSLKRLALALNTSPDEIIDWKMQEDKGYLTLMSLSSLAFLFFPLLGIIVPLIFWVLKKDKLKNVDELGKAILNFEITWSAVFFGYGIIILTGLLSTIMGWVAPAANASFALLVIPVIFLYGYNVLVIVVNTIRVSRNKNYKYFPAFSIFK